MEGGKPSGPVVYLTPLRCVQQAFEPGHVLLHFGKNVISSLPATVNCLTLASIGEAIWICSAAGSSSLSSVVRFF
jgi:hypothetical protein